jgi:hypothetical protein
LKPDYPVSVREQIAYTVIPFVNLWAAHRIKKLINFVVLLIIIFAINFAVGFLIPFPFSIPIGIAIYLIMAIHYMKKWTMEWNNKVSSSSTPGTS